ncbi:MAG: DUF6079 family protein [Myxococcota bacterium]
MSTPRTLDDAFVIPRAEDLSALDFVIRLDAARGDTSLRRLVDDYVVTPVVADALPKLFGHMQTAVSRGEPYGHILHGGFGSGKSHLMTMLALLLERDPAAWGKDHPAFAALREKHRDWVAGANLLVVRVHMLSVRREGAALDEILYDAVNATLVAQGKTPFLVSGAMEVLAEIRREAADYGAAFWKRAETAGVGVGPEDLVAAEEAGEEGVQALAEAYLAMKGRSFQVEGLKPAWGEGLKRLTTHVRSQGFGGIAFLIDEFLLWLAEKAGEDFVSAINDMNTIVDYAGRRDAPVLVVFARQRNIKEFFPDLTNQDRIQERVDHHAKRFDVTQLQDVELRYIVAGRVLREKKDPAAIAAAIEVVRNTYRRAIDDLVGEAGPEVLDDVYPFHPALIDVLVDVSNLMQRERSALRLLYELLSANRTLPLDHLLPVGRAFDHVFPEAGVEAAQKTETLQKIHAEWYQRLRPRIDNFVQNKAQNGDPISDERAQTLRQVIKTVLLGLVSPRLAGKGNERLTVDRLVKLNFADADGEQMKNKVNRLSADLVDFQIFHAPEIQITGEKGAAIVSYALGQASLGEVLRRAEEKVRNKQALLAAIGKRLDRMLPKLQGLVSSKDGLRYDLVWRGTRRTGRVVFGNVREQPYETFRPGTGEDFRVLVDYPWDEPGHTVGEDIQRVDSVRKKHGGLTSAAWLPRHFSTQEERLLRELAAAAWVVDDGVNSELLASYGREERTLLLEQARNRLDTLQRQVDADLLVAYGAQAEVKALIGPRDPDLGTGTLAGDLDRIVRELLDRRHGQHPDYKLEATRPRVQQVEAWMRGAWGQSGSVHFDAETGSALEHIARPLELADVGQSRAAIEHHGRFVKEITAELGDHRSVTWGPIAEKLREAPYGLTDDVIDLLLVYVCLRGYRLLDASGERLEPKVGIGSKAVKLEKAELLELAAWSRARTLAQQALHVTVGDSHRSLSAQDRLAADLSTKATDARLALSTLHGRLVAFGTEGSERQQEVKTLIEKLAPLVKTGTDSFRLLTDWLAGWPEDDTSLRVALRAAGANIEALDKLDTTSRGHIVRARAGRLAARIETVLDELDERLRAREQVRPLRMEDVARFNKDARQIVAELVEGGGGGGGGGGTGGGGGGGTGGGGGGGGGGGVGPTPPGVTEEVVRVGTPNAESIAALIDRLQTALATGDLLSVDVTLRRRERER